MKIDYKYKTEHKRTQKVIQLSYSLRKTYNTQGSVVPYSCINTFHFEFIPHHLILFLTFKWLVLSNI